MHVNGHLGRLPFPCVRASLRAVSSCSSSSSGTLEEQEEEEDSFQPYRVVHSGNTPVTIKTEGREEEDGGEVAA